MFLEIFPRNCHVSVLHLFTFFPFNLLKISWLIRINIFETDRQYIKYIQQNRAYYWTMLTILQDLAWRSSHSNKNSIYPLNQFTGSKSQTELLFCINLTQSGYVVQKCRSKTIGFLLSQTNLENFRGRVFNNVKKTCCV